MVLRQAGRLAIVGVALGLAGEAGAQRLLECIVFEVPTNYQFSSCQRGSHCDRGIRHRPRAARSVGFAIDLAEVRGPVGLPGLAPVTGESLFPVGGGGGDTGPGEAHLDGLAAQSIIGIEGAHAVLEASLHRRVQIAGVAAVVPPDGPGAGLGVIGAHRQTVIGAVRPAHLVVVHVAVATHRDPQMLDAVVIEPVVAVGQPLLQHVVVVDPASGAQIEGVEAGEVVALSRLQVILGSKTEAHEGRGHAELEQGLCGHGFSNGIKKTISYCVKDAGGQIHRDGKIGATRQELDGWMKTLPQPWKSPLAIDLPFSDPYGH